jgi:hypothetical protein
MEVNGHTPAEPTTEESVPVRTGKKIGGSQSPSGIEEEKNILLLPEIKPRFLGCPTHFLVAAATELIKVWTQFYISNEQFPLVSVQLQVQLGLQNNTY